LIRAGLVGLMLIRAGLVGLMLIRAGLAGATQSAKIDSGDRPVTTDVSPAR